MTFIGRKPGYTTFGRKPLRGDTTLIWVGSRGQVKSVRLRDMTQFKFRNLPRGFEFVLAQHEIRSFVKSMAANFELVEFGNIGYSEGKDSPRGVSPLHFPCRLRAQWREGEGLDGEWVFGCEFEGIRTEHFEGRREEIKAAVLSHIRQWVESKLALPVTAPRKDCRALVCFDLSDESGEIVSLSEWD